MSTQQGKTPDTLMCAGTSTKNITESQMNLTIVSNVKTMSSIELVDLINAMRADFKAELAHSDFLKKVEKVLGEVAGNFSGYYVASNGKKNPCYYLPKREAELMVMSESYAVQAKVYDRMTELESAPTFAIPSTLSGALRMASEQAEQLEVQARQLLIAAPAVEFVGKYVEAAGLKGFREVCKILHANESRFREFLLAKRVMYKLNNEWTPYQNHIDAERITVKAGVSETTGHAFSRALFTTKGIEWVAGEFAKFGLLDAVEFAA